jgi:cytochrome b561
MRSKSALIDRQDSYGAVSRVIHWTMAIAVFALFALGWWMVGLDYYSPYYNSAPELHRNAGMLLLAVLVVRIVWRMGNVKPGNDGLAPFEQHAARIVHVAFYPLLAVLMVSGYLISTADGRPIDVYGWLHVPAIAEIKGFEDVAGFVHEWTAYAIMGLAAIHSAAAIRHRFMDKRTAGNRMW